MRGEFSATEIGPRHTSDTLSAATDRTHARCYTSGR